MGAVLMHFTSRRAVGPTLFPPSSANPSTSFSELSLRIPWGPATVLGWAREKAA